MNIYNESINTDVLKKLVDDILLKFNISSIVETGTNTGLKSTKIFAETGFPVDTIECNKYLIEQSKINLEKFKNVTIHYGYSIPKIKILNRLCDKNYFVNYFNHKNSIKTDVSLDKNPIDFYVNELLYCSDENISEDLLEKLTNNNIKQLIFLDSAGCVGDIEFETIMNIPINFLINKIILMDDINHIKHINSIKYLESNNIKFNTDKERRLAYFNINNSI